MDLGLRDATAVVTGGSSGMGRAAAECLADDGARVAVFARRQAELDETVSALRKRGSPDPVGLSVDVTDAAAITGCSCSRTTGSRRSTTPVTRSR